MIFCCWRSKHIKAGLFSGSISFFFALYTHEEKKQASLLPGSSTLVVIELCPAVFIKKTVVAILFFKTADSLLLVIAASTAIHFKLKACFAISLLQQSVHKAAIQPNSDIVLRNFNCAEGMQ